MLVERCIGKRPSRTHDRRKHGVYLVVYSEELAAALEKHGGKFAHAKRFSKAVMDLPPHRQRLATDAYYRGDGSRCVEGRLTRVRCCTVSRILAFQIQEMLARQGIFAYMNTREAFDERMKDGRVIRHRKRYVLFYAENARGRRAIRRDGYFLVPVRSLRRELYDGFVYNFETAKEPHSYLVKGFAVHNCTAPMRDENQLHAAVVELVALDDAQIKYSTVQNWYPGDENGVGGIYNFVTKRGECRGRNSKISWTQVETGSAITWKYPSCVLKGEGSSGEFYSVAVANNYQQADTGTKMIHIGKNTKSNIVSKGISAGHAQNTYRGLVKILPSAEGARNFTQCDSLLMGPDCGAHTFPYMEVKNPTATVEHEASTSKIGEDQLFYCLQRGISAGHAVNTYRGLVKILPGAEGARNFTQCDSLLMGGHCAAHTFPYMEVKNPGATVEHEASTSKIGEDQLFYCLQRGISAEDAVNMIVSGFCKVVFKELPMEFAVEAQNLLSVSLEGAVG